MRLASAFCAALAGVLAVGVAVGAASAETRWEQRHPRQDQVLDRAAHVRRAIRTERAEGGLTRAQARRLLAADADVIRQDRLLARANGGFITSREQRFLNREESAVRRRVPG